MVRTVEVQCKNPDCRQVIVIEEAQSGDVGWCTRCVQNTSSILRILMKRMIENPLRYPQHPVPAFSWRFGGWTDLLATAWLKGGFASQNPHNTC